MASSRKRRSSEARGGRPARALRPDAPKSDGDAGLISTVGKRLSALVRAGDRVVVALSGGVDSVVLLDLMDRLRARLGAKLSALHVNHQLSPNAARWAAFCRRLTRERGIPCSVVKVAVRRSNSIEGAARAARYAVFERQRCEWLVLAQHKDDQVETVLLNLLRGTGVKGLAGMPPIRHPPSFIPHPSILRPLLDATRQEILEYAKVRRLRWVEDESNDDIGLGRNFLRHEVLPRVARRFPAYHAAVARAAAHAAEATGLLDELAAADGAVCLRDGTLDVAGLAGLSPARARNLLRYFLAAHGLLMPDARHLEEVLRQALSAKEDAQPLLRLGERELRRFEGRLHVVAADVLPRGAPVCRWRGERKLELTALGGMLTMAPARGHGISAERLAAGAVTIGARRGGERLQPDCRRPRRTVKNLLQEARVAPWERERLPFLYCAGVLVWVPGIGIDCAYQAGPRERGIVPSWHSTRPQAAIPEPI